VAPSAGVNVLIVFAHPDDESYGPGATIAGLAASGARLTLLTFTRGEHSTLGVGDGIGPAELAKIRTEELRLAARELGIEQVRQHDYPDGGLRDTPRPELQGLVRAALEELRPALVITFGTGGISRHPDHITASEVAVAAVQAHAAGPGQSPVPVYGWAMPGHIAARLKERLGREYPVVPDERIVEVPVRPDELAAQWRAVQHHRSQHQPPPWPFQIRLEVQAGHEYLERLLPTEPLAKEPLLRLLGR
jgi:LmbE family N-acetylglucosaminyl deacetylase